MSNSPFKIEKEADYLGCMNYYNKFSICYGLKTKNFILANLFQVIGTSFHIAKMFFLNILMA